MVFHFKNWTRSNPNLTTDALYWRSKAPPLQPIFFIMKMKTLPIDFSRINLEEFFGCIEATNTSQMKSNAFKTFRTYLQEKSFAKWSDTQLEYVGDHEDGRDFVDHSEIFYEMKGSLGLFNKNGSCKRVVLINKRPGKRKQNELKKEDIQKTFEYMLLVDTKNMSIAYTDWDTVYSRVECDGAGATFKLENGDYKMIATNIVPTEKQIDASQLLNMMEVIL